MLLKDGVCRLIMLIMLFSMILCFFFFLFFFFFCCCFCFFFNDTATTEIYTLSLHDALPIYINLSHRIPNLSVIYIQKRSRVSVWQEAANLTLRKTKCESTDRKSTRLNSSHTVISYAVFCLKKKNKKQNQVYQQKKNKPYT